MTINVEQEDDNTFTISWDENDPYESVFNDWTEQDFIDLLTDFIQKETDKLNASDGEDNVYSTDMG